MLKNKKNRKKCDFKNVYDKNSSKRKLVIITIIAAILIIAITIFLFNLNTNKTKKIKIGNNSTSQEIVDYILNIQSYEAQVEIEVKSNKNSNKYKIKQTYINSQENSQEVLGPSNIEGVKIVREGNILKIENTKLSITKIIEDYQDLTQNNLDLSAFIENYKFNSNSKFREEDNQIIMETTAQNENNYQKYETLYVSKEDGKPTRMEIKDINQNIIIYIIYNEIKI